MVEVLFSIEGSCECFVMVFELLGCDLLVICQGDSGGGDGLDDFNDICNIQFVLFVIELVLVDNFQQQGCEFVLVVGYSLGELVVFYSVGVFGLEIGLQLMKICLELMVNVGGGVMMVVIGFDCVQLDDLVVVMEGVSIVNDNSDVQVVIFGFLEVVESVSGVLKCKCVIFLVVFGVFYFLFMVEVVDCFVVELDNVFFLDVCVLVFSNSVGSVSISVDEFKQCLKQQMIIGVCWCEIMLVMIDSGVDILVEIGLGNVFSGLVKCSMSGVIIVQIFGVGDFGQ